MKIKMLTGISGVDFSLSPSEETDRFSDAEAIRMIDAGMAVPVVIDAVETTTVDIAAAERRTAGRKPRAK